MTTLRGNVHLLARPQYDKGPADPSLPAERMQLVLQRSFGQEMALRQFLGSVQDKNAAQYRKWLTPEQFGAQYGVSDADVQTISVWLESQGLRVSKVNKAHTIVEFSGSIGQLQAAFHTQIHSFAVNGEQHLAVPGTSPGIYTFSVVGTDTVTATTTTSTTFTVTVQ